MRTRGGRWGGREPAALWHALEAHGAELVAQNRALDAANAELRRRNEALAAGCERYRTLSEEAPVACVTIDRAGVILDVNHAAEAMLDAPRGRLLGLRLEELVEDAGRGGLRSFVDAVFAGGHARSADLPLRRTASAPVEAFLDGALACAAPPLPPRGVLAIVDVTARRQHEAARRRAQDEVFAVVSHDLRGPLNAITLACDALANGLAVDELRECVAAIKRSSARCERLINDLLGMAHLESGRLRLSVAALDLGELVRQVCRDHEPAVAAAGASMTIQVPAQPMPVLGDRDRLHQVLSNLIGNALVHARGAAIEVAVVARGADVAVAVTDHGPGIPADELPCVFERYRQGARHRGGAGLGLAIVKGLVEAHHGTVAVTSRPGRGARFEVVLPRHAAPVAIAPAGDGETSDWDLVGTDAGG